MTWTTQPYCTRADVKLALDPNLTNVDDTFIDMDILEAQALIDGEIGYMFQQDGTSSVPATRLYDGDASFDLATDDIVSLYGGGGCTPTPCGAVFETVTNIFLSGGIWVTGTTTTTDITADIILKPNNFAAVNLSSRRMVRNSGLSFQLGTQNYKVLGIFGQPRNAGQVYAGVPNDIMRATIRLAIHYYKMRDTAYSDMVQGQGVREKYNKEIPIDVMRVIKRYSHTRFITRSS